MTRALVLAALLALQGCAVMINIGNDSGLGSGNPSAFDPRYAKLCRPE